MLNPPATTEGVSMSMVSEFKEFVIFLMIKQVNRLKRAAPPAPPAAPAPTPEDVLLLREIRDALKK
jgi:large-conductance mechanosensitive channel